jgi:hypothetical protein
MQSRVKQIVSESSDVSSLGVEDLGKSSYDIMYKHFKKNLMFSFFIFEVIVKRHGCLIVNDKCNCLGSFGMHFLEHIFWILLT